jgi:O-antigen/teichoic acid export membrane protein
VAVTPQPRSLLRNLRSALSGNSVYALCQFGMLSVLALLTNTTEVGRYGLALAITAPVFLFASLKLRQIQVTDAQNHYSFGEYLAQRLLTSTVATASVIGVVALLGMDPRTTATTAAVAVFKALESIIDILYGAMQRREQLHLVARSQMLRGVGGFAVFAGSVWMTGKVEVAAGGLAAFTIIQVATNFWHVRKLGVQVKPAFSWVTFRRLTWLALPLGVALSVSSLSINVPRYFIGRRREHPNWASSPPSPTS